MTTQPHGAAICNILFVTDEPSRLPVLERALAGAGDLALHPCFDYARAAETAREHRAHVILLEYSSNPDWSVLDALRQAPATLHVPIVLLTDETNPAVNHVAYQHGASDFLPTLPHRIELLAKLRYHAAAHVRLLERNQAYEDLAASEKLLASEIEAAKEYVRRLLPDPVTRPVDVGVSYQPQIGLSGDMFGFEALDDEHFAMFVLDVSGHGVAAALHAVSIVQRIRSLAGVDPRNPGDVLTELNKSFPMETTGRHFTMWYGVYRPADGVLDWCSGAHPSLYWEAPGQKHHNLDSDHPPLGFFDDLAFQTEILEVKPGSRLHLYSDGVYEIEKDNGEMWGINAFTDFVAQTIRTPNPVVDVLLPHVRSLAKSDQLDDDFTILEVRF